VVHVDHDKLSDGIDIDNILVLIYLATIAVIFYQYLVFTENISDEIYVSNYLRMDVKLYLK